MESTLEPSETPAGSPELMALLAEMTEKLPTALERIEAAKDLRELEDTRVAILGKKGLLAEINAKMGPLSPAEKPIAGKNLNNRKAQLIHAFDAKKELLEAAALAASLEAERLDITMPGIRPRAGHLHPVAQTVRDISAIFRTMGFTVETGPEIETEWFNFEALNIAPDHPARDMQDTFYTERGRVLRTHTSPTQIRTMLRKKPPIAIVVPGRVYRCDADVTHSPMFHQIEGLYIDRHVTMGHLKGVLNEFFSALYGYQIPTRFRPSFFPFTEPSAEMDIQCVFCKGDGCRVCSNSGWLEVLGCGMVHPKVLKNAGLDPEEWKGFAFGLGADRIAMLKYGINDIRLLTENDLRFLRQF